MEEASTSIQQVERLLFRFLRLLRRMGLPENVVEAINRLQRMISMLRMARIAVGLFQAASGPVGWALAAVTAGTFVAEGYEFYMDVTYDTARGAE